MGESLYSIECSCISKFVLIQHILRTQVSDTGPFVLWSSGIAVAYALWLLWQLRVSIYLPLALIAVLAQLF